MKKTYSINFYLITKMAKIDSTLFMTKQVEKPYPLGLHIPIYSVARIREYPPPQVLE